MSRDKGEKTPQDFYVVCAFLTDNVERSTDGDRGTRVDLADVLAGVRLLDVLQLEEVSEPVVVTHAQAVVVDDHLGVDGKGALFVV